MESLDSILAGLQDKYTSEVPKPERSVSPSVNLQPSSQKDAKSKNLPVNLPKSDQAALDALCRDSSSQNLASQAIASSSSSSSDSLNRLLNDLRSGSSISPPTNTSSNEAIQISQAASSVSVPVNISIKKDLQQVADRQKHQSQQEITKQATAWIKQLDPLSGEGLWFEEFAKNYPSKLEAAIALLSS